MSASEKTFDIAVIGAGASGYAAAVTAARLGSRVCLLERNAEPLKKIYATGGGRCNLSAEDAPGRDEALGFLRSAGLEFAVEEGRYYPRSMQAASVASALTEAAERAGVVLRCGFAASQITRTDAGFLVKAQSGEAVGAERIVIATGGKAGIQYGCYGDGFRFAAAFGHRVVKPIPALVALTTASDLKKLAGVRAAAKVTLFRNGEPAASDEGEIQFTAGAVSGICTFNVSREYRLAPGVSYTLEADFFPEFGAEEFASYIKDRASRMSDPYLGLVPDRLAAELRPGLKKSLSFEINGCAGWKRAQTTCGGVDLAGVSEDFGSLTVPGLFFAGEVLDYDGPCGGYNLTWAFTSGIRAGKAAAG